jgi:hypothetical protein
MAILAEAPGEEVVDNDPDVERHRGEWFGLGNTGGVSISRLGIAGEQAGDGG